MRGGLYPKMKVAASTQVVEKSDISIIQVVNIGVGDLKDHQEVRSQRVGVRKGEVVGIDGTKNIGAMAMATIVEPQEQMVGSVL